MRKKNFKKGPFVYRRTLTLADKKKGSNPSSSARRDRRLMHYFLHGMPSKERMHICMLFGVCVFFMALVKSLPEIFSDELDMRKKKF